MRLSRSAAIQAPLAEWGADESLNGKFPDECLSAEWFRTREEARTHRTPKSDRPLDRCLSTRGYLICSRLM